MAPRLKQRPYPPACEHEIGVLAVVRFTLT